MSTISTVASTAASSTSNTSSTSSTSGLDTNGMIANNFQTFLTLLTTQLQNQNPLDPLDTNQFTQQLVEFAQVEQQMATNSDLSTLVSLQQSAQSTAALSYIGATVVVNGSNAALTNNQATWTLNSSKPATATITITDSTGQTAYSGTYAVNAGNQTFTWNGVGNNGAQWPAGNYTLTATAVDANNQSVGISTQVQATVDSVDLTQNPPVLSLDGQNYTINQIQKIVRPGSTTSTN